MRFTKIQFKRYEIPPSKIDINNKGGLRFSWHTYNNVRYVNEIIIGYCLGIFQNDLEKDTKQC